MGLSFYLLSSIIMIHDHNDTCSWPLDPSNYFAVKSLYKVIWSDSHTKMIKIFSLILVLLTQQINFIDTFCIYK